MNELLEITTKEIKNYHELIPDKNIVYSFYCIIVNQSQNSITIEFDKNHIILINQSYRINNLRLGNFGRAWVKFSDKLEQGTLLAFTMINIEDINKIKVI